MERRENMKTGHRVSSFYFSCFVSHLPTHMENVVVSVKEKQGQGKRGKTKQPPCEVRSGRARRPKAAGGLLHLPAFPGDISDYCSSYSPCPTPPPQRFGEVVNNLSVTPDSSQPGGRVCSGSPSRSLVRGSLPPGSQFASTGAAPGQPWPP
jgi:hypothetical protein